MNGDITPLIHIRTGTNYIVVIEIIAPPASGIWSRVELSSKIDNHGPAYVYKGRRCVLQLPSSVLRTEYVRDEIHAVDWLVPPASLFG